jgi:hypothetical protein
MIAFSATCKHTIVNQRQDREQGPLSLHYQCKFLSGYSALRVNVKFAMTFAASIVDFDEFALSILVPDTSQIFCFSISINTYLSADHCCQKPLNPQPSTWTEHDKVVPSVFLGHCCNAGGQIATFKSQGYLMDAQLFACWTISSNF